MHSDLTREIIGAFYHVYRVLGHGFAELVYQRALPVAPEQRGPRPTFRRMFLSAPHEGSTILRA
jgi:hypothetical protein